MIRTGNIVLDSFASIQEAKEAKQNLKDFSEYIKPLKFSPDSKDRERFKIYNSFIKQALVDIESETSKYW